MAEAWSKISGTEDYEVTDSVVVRKVNKTDLEARKAQLQAEVTDLQTRITAIDADIAQIDALEA